MQFVIRGATIIDGVTARPIDGKLIWIENGRIKAVGSNDELQIPAAVESLDARGKFAIPGLMDANVHLMSALRMEDLVRFEDRYEEVIAEAAQIALRSGLTTVFDTWGPRGPLMRVRDQVNSGRIPGSRIYCAGNIIGLDGPFSQDFFPRTLDVASPDLIERVNSLWVENVGPPLTWMTPDQVAREIRVYLEKGVDFIKYASSDHRAVVPRDSAYLAFSERAQAAIVEEAHRAGVTAQAHAASVEALRVAIEAAADIVQHCNVTAPTPIPEMTLRMRSSRTALS